MNDVGSKVDIFISRAGADNAIAQEIARILEEAGYSVILQDWDFGHADFVAKMDDALIRSQRVVTLLSHEYLASNYCGIEWRTVYARDPGNFDQRLVLLRVTECEPIGILCTLASTDLVSLRDKPAQLRAVVLARLDPNRKPRAADVAAAYQRDAQPILHRDISPVADFIGRDAAMCAIDEALRTDASLRSRRPQFRVSVGSASRRSHASTAGAGGGATPAFGSSMPRAPARSRRA